MTAVVRVDPDRRLGEVDPRIYGGFVEHVGRCIYGGLFEPGSPLSDERGFRRDVLAALRELRTPLLRWPGGNFASGYHWRDGVGAVAERPRHHDLAWGVEEPNTFGTEEFLAYCGELGAEPFICLNMGDGSLEEALAWVAHCGRRVRLWALGNEVWGDHQIGTMTAGEYVRRAREWAKLLRRLDPGVKLVACGRDGWSDWDREVVDGLARHVDYLSIHWYTGAEDHWRNMAMAHLADRGIETARALIDRALFTQGVEGHTVKVAADEWNLWYRSAPIEHGERYHLGDALAVATYLSSFVRHAGTVKIACLAQMVNVLAPIVTSPEGLFRQTIFHPLRLFAEHLQGTSVDVFADGPAPAGVAALEACATVEGRRLKVAVVNRDPEAAVDARVEVIGHRVDRARAEELNGPELRAENSFEGEPVTVTRGERRLPEVTFPAHSLTVLEVDL